MKRKYIVYDGLTFLSRRIPLIVLIACFCFGIQLGQYYASCGNETYFLLMRLASVCPVSIVGLASVTFLPFLFSAFAVYFSHTQFLLPICFLKAFMFSCCAFSATWSFGSAGWLVRLLLQFTDICTLPLLCWFWIRHKSGELSRFWQDIVLCGLLVTVVCVVDYCIVSPYLVSLIEL